MRNIITGVVFLLLSFSFIAAEAKNQQTQEQFAQQREQQYQAFKKSYLERYAEFKRKYDQDLNAYRLRILEKWGEVDVSDNKQVVNYSDDETKTVVDFEKGEIIVSIIHDEDETPEPTKVVEALEELQTISVEQIAPVKPKQPANAPPFPMVDILASFGAQLSLSNYEIQGMISIAEVKTEAPQIDNSDFEKEREFVNQQIDIGEQSISAKADQLELPDEMTTEVEKDYRAKATQSLAANLPPITASVPAPKDPTPSIPSTPVKATTPDVIKPSAPSSPPTKVAATKKTPTNESDNLTKKRITRYKIPLKSKTKNQKVNSLLPQVVAQSEKWNVPEALVFAIIHTESSFNPMAVSHVPAYGLMQIVPTSAGIDVNMLLHKKKTPLPAEYLFDSDNNVEAGSAYYYLLYARYLKGIKDPTSRMYCAIAAYNTGSGNVGRVFNEGQARRLNKLALDTINSLQPEQVYQRLRKDLPYEETQRYLKKVRDRIDEYKAILEETS